jgi:hypothetical protein
MEEQYIKNILGKNEKKLDNSRISYKNYKEKN